MYTGDDLDLVAWARKDCHPGVVVGRVAPARGDGRRSSYAGSAASNIAMAAKTRAPPSVPRRCQKWCRESPNFVPNFMFEVHADSFT